MQIDHKLDNPVWFSLSESHQNFSVNYTDAKFYHPDYCPFGCFQKGKNVAEHLAKYSALVDNFFIVGERPEVSKPLRLNKDVASLQMVIRDKIDMEINEAIVALTNDQAELLFDLINLVQPGYFKRKTALLGNYFGIFKNGELVAVTGERMKMNEFVEVSAVVTHPGHTGKRYAKQLVAHTVNNIFAQDKTPYLHVVETNTPAIRLYEGLGFKLRRKISFWNIVKGEFETR